MSISKTMPRSSSHTRDRNTFSSSALGLSNEEVELSRRKYGANLFTRQKRKGFLKKYIESFGDPIIRILLAALIVNVLLLFQTHDLYETLGIACAVFLSTFVSTLSEYGSESAFLRLQREAENLRCRVKRDGMIVEIPIGEIVVGDLVLLEAGEKIPADGILIFGSLDVDQSAINGESTEAKKRPDKKREEKWSPNTVNQLFRGTMVSAGEGIMEVCHVGDHTMYGGLAKELQGETQESPMKLRLTKLARQISKLGYTAAVLVAFSDLFGAIVIENRYVASEIWKEICNAPLMASHLMHAFLLAVSIIVVAVPEGLPMMITVVLSSNMMRMQRDNVMVRKLIGIETAGSLNILFTDKTGTLTTGNLEVETIVSGNGVAYHSLSQIRNRPKFAHLLVLSCLCNGTATVSLGKAIGGNSTERALVNFCEPMAKDVFSVQKRGGAAFSSNKKYSWTRIDRDGETVLVKGAPEKLLPKCIGYWDEDGNARMGGTDKIWQTVQSMTRSAMRVILLATCDRDFEDEQAQLLLVAVVGIRDRLRPKARHAVETVKRAGVQTVMITGDNRETAVAVARSAGILSGCKKERILTGEELEEMCDDAVKAILPSLRVVARALPSDKSRLVRLSQELGLVVGMTGDGINDATALKKADVGFAMGAGTEVAKQAGDIVILDNDFASVTKAILYGRTIFHSIRKFIVFQLTMNFCAVAVSLIGPFVGMDNPVTVMQMLWINMIMDTLAGLAFAGESPKEEYMKEKPKKRNESILNREMMEQILITGGYTVLLCLSFLCLPIFRETFGFSRDEIGFMTAFFTLFVFCGIFNAFNARTHRIRLTSDLGKNKMFLAVMSFVSFVQILLIFVGGTMFRTHPLSFFTIRSVVLLAFTVIPFDLIRKGTERVFQIRD